MKTEKWLRFFKEHSEVRIFHINHLKAFGDGDASAVTIALSRLHKRKVITRICRGFYANPFATPTVEEVAGTIYQPSYISLESALNLWGMVSQIPQVLTCVTTRLPRTFRTTFGSVEYRQVKKEYFWGFIQKGDALVAEREKALLDWLYLRRERRGKKRRREFDISEFNLSEINRRKLERYARRMAIDLTKILS